MTFFESLLVLLLAAIALLQVARRLGLPYPAMLAAAGVIVSTYSWRTDDPDRTFDLPRDLCCPGAGGRRL
jgi:hypothetical protein